MIIEPMLCKYLCLKTIFSMLKQSHFFFCNIATFANMQAPRYHGENVRYTGWQRNKIPNEIKFKRGVALGVWLPRCLGLFFGSHSREPKWRLTEIYCP